MFCAAGFKALVYHYGRARVWSINEGNISQDLLAEAPELVPQRRNDRTMGIKGRKQKGNAVLRTPKFCNYWNTIRRVYINASLFGQNVGI